VYSFKLNSGEELIAKVIQAGGEFIQIEEPVSIAPSPQGMGLVPSIFTADPKGEFRLNTSSVSIYAETEDAVRMKYLEATTGIKVPDKKLILG
jgi:citrate lyase synthetase